MLTFRQVFNSGRGYKFKDYNGLIGLEIETETESLSSYPSHFFHLAGEEGGHNKYDLDSKYWYAVEDGSLRNYGMEFPLIQPLDFATFCKALDEFKEITKNVKFIENPPGASIHVHLNMLNETLITLANLITLWVKFETVLIEFCGVSRRSNLFALPVRVAERGLDNYCLLLKLLSEKHDMAISNFSEKNCKYSALNIATLARLGTVEIRTMRGTTDTDVIKTWVGILCSMLKFARTPGLTPYYILQDARYNLDDLFDKVFGEYSNILKNPSWKSQVERNLHYIYTLVDSVVTWDNFADYTPVPTVEKSKAKKFSTGAGEINLGGPMFTTTAFNPFNNIQPAVPEQSPNQINVSQDYEFTAILDTIYDDDDEEAA